ncbi:MAG: hypothetical protein A2Y23_11340 [Clostridiales bacterium GWB2_37_7]|nr:MAG: hypothetical protein A2Y23_11340 [Clostridiales bacterium GWB2_37_7]
MNRLKQILLAILGSISIALGILGIFLPLLPTTPFLLLGASCYIKGSPKLYQWLIGNKLLGQYIRNFREGNGIPLKTKIVAVTMLWITMSYSIIFVVANLYIRVCLALIAAGVTWHIVSQKTLKLANKEEPSEKQEEECIDSENKINKENINKKDMRRNLSNNSE